jgi:hypothetical protein
VESVTVSEEEITAWHEAGHAFVAVYLGGHVQSLSIDPDYDDGPRRSGDVEIHWKMSGMSERELAEKSILVALAGPVAEMIHSGDPFHPATVAEWSQDWSVAWQTAAFIADKSIRLAMLEKTTIELHQILAREHHWSAIGAVVDHLLAYECLEGETVHEVIAEWIQQ